MEATGSMGKIREGLVHGVMLLWRDGDADVAGRGVVLVQILKVYTATDAALQQDWLLYTSGMEIVHKIIVGIQIAVEERHTAGGTGHYIQPPIGVRVLFGFHRCV